MADGTTKAIEDIEIGDWVWATDPETGEAGPRRVTDTIVGDGTKQLIDIEIDGATITATDGHPFWVDDQGRWIDADDLDPGDLLVLADGTTTDVDAIAERTGVLTVHNLTVDGIHTYHVMAGDDPVLVHNCIVPGNERAVAQRIADGHAFGKHVVTEGQFPGVRTRAQFADLVEGIITNPQHTRHLNNGRMAYWRDGVVTIVDPRSADLGTTFAPRSGLDYFWDVLK